MGRKIALVDDDQNILTSVSIMLEAEGYEVETYTDGARALEGIGRSRPDIAILDIKMPRMDGMELLTRIRRTSAMPVIFLTSKDDEIDEMLGLRMGADDYIRKPFSQRLLLERIRALLRRIELGAPNGGLAVSGHGDRPGGPETSPAPGASALQGRGAPSRAGASSGGQIVRGALVLDPERHLCTWKDKAVQLTVTEFLIMQSLAQRPGHVKTRDQLMDAAYGEHIYVDDRTIDSHIKRLRRKFKEADSEFAQIETLYGLGYRYREP